MKNVKPLDLKLDAIHHEVYDLAKSIQTMLRHAIEAADDSLDDATRLVDGAKNLACQIAWMADLASGGRFEGADFEKATFPVTSNEQKQGEISHG